MNSLTPEVSSWYQDITDGHLFEVVAYDEENGFIEYQHVDGEVGEYDLSVWQDLELTAAEAPEDWRSSYELSPEDKITPDATIIPENWSGALATIEPPPSDPDADDDYY